MLCASMMSCRQTTHSAHQPVGHRSSVVASPATIPAPLHPQRPADVIKHVAIGMLSVGVVVVSGVATAAESAQPTSALQLKFESPIIKQKLAERDEAMSFQCRGGMFDCDGDRRVYAKKQYQNFVTRMDGKEAPKPQSEPAKP